MHLTRWYGGGLVGLLAGTASLGAPANRPADVAELAEEVRNKGWIVYGAIGPRAEMDLYLMRPDGSDRRRITNTRDMHEGAARFSPDGRKLMYRRISKGTRVHHNRWGFQGHVVIANADGSNPVAIGKDGEHPWACWGPDGKQISCLTFRGIQIIDLATNKVVRQLPRKGIYQQLFWSPDGEWFCGVTNLYGEMWTVARMNAKTGEINPLCKLQDTPPEEPSEGSGILRGAECTPDWFPDSKHVLFSRRPRAPVGYPWTQLWMASGDGKQMRLVHGEDGRHLYGGTFSPDGKYLLYSRVLLDGAGGLVSGTYMGLTRFRDVPTYGGKGRRLRDAFPNAKREPVLNLPAGYEPDWTYADVTKQGPS